MKRSFTGVGFLGNDKYSTGLDIIGDELECAYHGWRFNDKSECVVVPYLADNQKLPSCKIRRYSVKEQNGFIWLFPGNVELSDATSLQPMGVREVDEESG